MASDVEKRLRILIEANDRTQAAFNAVQNRIKQTQIMHKAMAIRGEKLTGQALINEKKKLLIFEQVNHTQRVHLQNQKLMINKQKRLVTDAKQFKFEYLGLMFAGMQLQRITDRFLRSAITAYNEAFEETSQLEAVTNRLSAAWRFFQFSLVDALAQSEGFASLIETVSRLVDWFSNLDESLRLGIIKTIAAGFAVGGAFFAFGASVLAWNSLKLAFAPGAGAAGLLRKITSNATLMKFIKSGIVINAVLNLMDAATFERALKAVGEGMALYGAISGKRWFIAIGVTFIFINPLKDLGENLQRFAENMFRDVWDDATDESVSAAGNIRNVFKLAFLGFPSFIAGSIVRAPADVKDAFKDVYQYIEFSNDAAARQMEDTIIPAFDSDEGLTGSAERAAVEVSEVADAINAIPDNTTKTITIRTVYETSGGASASNISEQPA